MIQMKKSEDTWIGEIPETWTVWRLKFLSVEPLQYGANEAAELDDRELPRYIRITDIKEDGTLYDETFRSLPIDKASGFLLEDGDILLARSGATVGKSFQYNLSWGIAAFAGYLIRFRPDNQYVHSRFAFYFLNSACYWAIIDSSLIQATIQNFSAEKYANINIPIPSLDIQTQIAKYLDYKTAQIDRLIAKKKELIEKLNEKRIAVITNAVTKGLDPGVKVKDSGVDWLGEVPEHWEVQRFKNISSVRYGLSEPPEYIDDGLFFIRATDISSGIISTEKMKQISAEDVPWARNPSVQTGEIIVVRSGAYTGDSAIIPPELNGAIAGFDMVINVNNGHSEFIAFSFLSTYMLNAQIELARTRAAQPHLNAEQLGTFYVVFPPIAEQVAIAKHISETLAKLDMQKEKVNTIIKRLTEYRTALITAAVTGKIDVRDIEIPSSPEVCECS